jgi:hypothetical protein
VLGIVESVPFQMKTVAGPEVAPATTNVAERR